MKKDLYYHSNNCRGSIHHWAKSPIIVLNGPHFLYPTIENLMKNPQRLDEIQVRLRLWYDEHMKLLVGNFEEYMFESYKKDAIAAQ